MNYNDSYPILYLFQDKKGLGCRNEFYTIWEFDFLSLSSQYDVDTDWSLNHNPWIPLWDQYSEFVWF